jgi:hypothetical protein
MKLKRVGVKNIPNEVVILRTHLETVVTIQYASLRKLLISLGDVPHDIADSFEDAANRYLDLAQLIRVTNPIDKKYKKEAHRILKSDRKPRS